MRFTIVAVGKLKERFWDEACAEYLKRLQPYGRTEVREVPDVDPHRVGGEEGAKLREGEGILSVLDSLPTGTRVVLLAIEGKERSSVDFSQHLEKLAVDGVSNVAFVIGGSDGVSEAVRKRSDETLSFGPITLPHNLARVVLLEQIYRACRIARGEPYHK